MMGKNPAFLFYPGDWTRDLDDHPLEVEGAWIRICCRLWWAPQKGQLTLSLDRWASILRLSTAETTRIINYLFSEKIANGKNEHNGRVTIISRRMRRDEREKEFNKLRQKRFRKKHDNNAPVTDVSQKYNNASSVSVSVSNKILLQEGIFLISEESKTKWQEAYPAIDIEQEIKKAETWIEANPRNKKSNWNRFLINWFGRAQDKAPPIRDQINLPSKINMGTPIERYENCTRCGRKVKRESIFDVGCVMCWTEEQGLGLVPHKKNERNMPV
jgi:hypothetical protein